MINAIWLKLATVGILIVAIFAGIHEYNKYEQGIGASAQFAIDDAAATRLKVNAAHKLADLQIDKEVADKAMRDFKNNTDVQYVKSQQTVASLASKLANLGRLRDPYAQASGSGSGSGSPKTGSAAITSVSTNDGAQTSGLLSPEFTGFLNDKTNEADTINVAYGDCKNTLVKVLASPAFAH
jgi:hypothetical protein